ncbi:MAG TPA: HAD family hydrolase [candidate division Zixibacteria bacterium]|nr:HAD family hydrolase [candidate division Zixibacteria bacterium]
MGNKIAVMLDRDGTVIVDVGYIDDPERIEILPGAVEAIVRLNEAGILAILISNQSGVARGLLSIERAREIDSAVLELFAQRGARIDASYFCPHHPDAVVPEFRADCRNRKPNPGMAERAAEEHDIDLRASFVVGDKFSDLQLALNIGAEGILVRTGEGEATEAGFRETTKVPVFDTVSGAVGYILSKIVVETIDV